MNRKAKQPAMLTRNLRPISSPGNVNGAPAQKPVDADPKKVDVGAAFAPFAGGFALGLLILVIVLVALKNHNNNLVECRAPSAEYTSVQSVYAKDTTGQIVFIGGGYYYSGTGSKVGALRMLFSSCGSPDKRLKSVTDFAAYIDGKLVVFPKAVVIYASNSANSPLALKP